MLKIILVVIVVVIFNVVVKIVCDKVLNKTEKRKNNVEQNIEEEEEDKSNVKTLQYPAQLRWVSIIASVFFNIILPIFILLYYIPKKDDNIIPYCLMCWCSLGLICGVLAYIFNMWKIEVHKEYIIYRSYLGKKRKYYFKDLELDYNNMGTRLYFKKEGKKVCSWHVADVNDSALLKRYKKVITEERKKIKEEQNTIKEQQCVQENVVEQEKTVIKPSWFMFTIAVLATIVFASIDTALLTCSYTTLKEEEITHIVMYILTGLWGIAFLGFLVYFFGYRIILKENTFVIRTILIKKEYPYKGVTWKVVKNHVVFYYKGKIISAWLVYIDSIRYLTWKTTEDKR